MERDDDPKKAQQGLWHKTRVDFVVSGRLLKENFRAFAGAQVIGVVAFLIVAVFMMGIFALLLPNLWIDAAQSTGTPTLVIAVVLLLTPANVVLYAFFGSLYGLSFDIMSSGDGFAQVRGSLTYFRKYWWQYSVVSVWQYLLGAFLIVGFTGTLETLGPMTPEGWIVLLVPSLVAWVWGTLFFELMPSLTATGSLRAAFKENWQLLKNHPGRLISTRVAYIALVEVPFLLFTIFAFWNQPALEVATAQEFSVGFFLLAIVPSILYFLISNPLLALLSTRIYNSIKMLREGDGQG